MHRRRIRRSNRRGRRGFSIVETLVVVAIICILMAMLSTALIKALRMAKSTAAGEEMRQDRIGNSAAAVHEGGDEITSGNARERAREQFRVVHEKGMEKITSSVLFIVRNDNEFRAYWHTLLNPANGATPEVTPDGELVAFGDGGERFVLPPVGADKDGGAYPVSWEFISTRLNETGRGDAGGNVVYSDGRREYVAYPVRFPMTRSVALLSHEFVSAFGP